MSVSETNRGGIFLILFLFAFLKNGEEEDEKEEEEEIIAETTDFGLYSPAPREVVTLSYARRLTRLAWLVHRTS